MSGKPNHTRRPSHGPGHGGPVVSKSATRETTDMQGHQAATLEPISPAPNLGQTTTRPAQQVARELRDQPPSCFKTAVDSCAPTFFLVQLGPAETQPPGSPPRPSPPSPRAIRQGLWVPVALAGTHSPSREDRVPLAQPSVAGRPSPPLEPNEGPAPRTTVFRVGSGVPARCTSRSPRASTGYLGV